MIDRVLRRWTQRGSFAKPIEATRSLVVPSLSLFEVFKRVSQQRDEDEALRAIAVPVSGHAEIAAAAPEH